MSTKDKPVSGFVQPAFGFHVKLDYMAMKGMRKKTKVPGFMREVLADNIRRLMEHHFASSSNKPRLLATKARVSLSTVQRLLSRETGATLDNVESIAEVFHLSSYQILVPMLDVANPQLIKGATLSEQRFYRSLQQSKSGHLKVA